MLALPHALRPLSCDAVDAQGIVSIYVDCGPLVLVVARGRLELRGKQRNGAPAASENGPPRAGLLRDHSAAVPRVDRPPLCKRSSFGIVARDLNPSGMANCVLCVGEQTASDLRGRGRWVHASTIAHASRWPQTAVDEECRVDRRSQSGSTSASIS